MHEDAAAFHLHDGKAPFRVHKAGLSEATAAKIRAMGAKKMAEGGDVAPFPGFVGRVQPGETIEQAAARLGGVFVPTERTSEHLPISPANPAPPTVDVMTGRSIEPPVRNEPVPAPPNLPLPPAPGETAAPSAMPPSAVEPPAPPPGPPPAAPKQPSAPVGAAPAQPAKPAGPSPFDEERKAALERGNIESQAATAKADAIGDLQRQLDAQAITRRESQAKAAQQADAALGDIQRAREEMKNVDVSVDTGRFWATRSTPQKIAGVIGLALGALGAGNDGVNRAAGLINSAIDRDLDAQKAEHEFKLKKGQSGIESATSMYGLRRQQGLDAESALDAARGDMLARAKAQADKAEATAASPLAKNNARMLSAQLSQKENEFNATLRQRAFDNSIKKQQADADTARANATGAGAGHVPATVITELADFKTAQTALSELGNTFKKLKLDTTSAKASSLLPDSVGRALGTDVSQYNSDALVAMQSVGKIMEGGKLAVGDEAKYKSMLPKPGDDEKVAENKINQAKDFLHSLYDGRVAALKSAGYNIDRPKGATPSASQTAEPPIHQNPITKEKIKWNGTAWVPV